MTQFEMGGWTWMMLTMMVMMMMVVRSDIAEEKNECADQLIGLAPCLGYVGGTGKTATPDCCTGLKQVVQKSKKCICMLVKDKDEPSLGFKINVTRALSLPTLCHAPANVSNCPVLLNLAPNSPEAKVFQDFAHGQNNINATTPSSTIPAGSATATSPDSSALRGMAAADFASAAAACILTITLALLVN